MRQQSRNFSIQNAWNRVMFFFLKLVLRKNCYIARENSKVAISVLFTDRIVRATEIMMGSILGCFIFSPFLKLKMLGVVFDRVFDADFEYVIFISL